MFYYYRGLQLEAVRDLEWKLVLPAAPHQRPSPAGGASRDTSPGDCAVFNLKTDVGETTDVAAQHPEIVARLERLVAQMKDDLGTTDPRPVRVPSAKSRIRSR